MSIRSRLDTEDHLDEASKIGALTGAALLGMGGLTAYGHNQLSHERQQSAFQHVDGSQIDDLLGADQPAPAPRRVNAPVEKASPPTPASKAEKQQFLAKMLPAIERANQEIAQTRAFVERAASRRSLNDRDQSILDDIMKRYRVKDGDIQTLLTRLDVIPPSLVLAQSAIESGWGKSRLAQKGNAMFGQKTTGARSVDALEDGTRYAAFDNINDAVASYMRNLNSHPAYASFRAARAAMKKKGQEVSGPALAPHLGAYSTREGDYTKQVVGMIKGAGLRKFDG